ncbi:hypothetical protein [Cellulomonas sp. Root137]|uniref:hypothetical protein n=1 Tax=Cellulomonas sp. Root137 TaxID=1736459 RepID=UPI0006FB26E2|nr:hypothetical protein [Cellulomonas sp. Root137]KQY47936.1 hypothetical protein ASD18_11930 [Cellulomonas sp. Root137]
MGVPKETSASIEIPVNPDLAWRALTTAAGAPTEPPVWHLEHAAVTLDTFSPAEAAGGYGAWNGVEYRVSAHLVPRGARQTLVVLTAESDLEPHGIAGAARAARSRRQVRRDLEALAAAVGEQVARWSTTAG